MTSRRLLILGAGGHGKVVADCARESGRWSEIVFFDDRFAGGGQCEHWPVLGDNAAFIECAGRQEGEAFVAIGNAEARLKWIGLAKEAGAKLTTVVHPSAVVSQGARVEQGGLLAPGAIVNIATFIDEGAIINTGASVDHDCELGRGVHVCPGARLAGEVQVGAGSWIGIGAVVRQGVRIGAHVMVGAGSVVVANVGDDVTVVGVPARVLKRSGT